MMEKFHGQDKSLIAVKRCSCYTMAENKRAKSVFIEQRNDGKKKGRFLFQENSLIF